MEGECKYDDGVFLSSNVTGTSHNTSYMLPVAQPRKESARQVARWRVSQLGVNLTYIYI